MTSKATIRPGTQVFADAGARTITGRIIEYGVQGKGSITATFGAQALVLPSDVKRVKLFRDHRDKYGFGTPVGWMTHIDNRPDGAYATFQVGVGPDGDQALHDAQGVRDGFSVEISELQLSADRRTVARAELDAVALVPMPAFKESRVQTVQFHQTPNSKEITTMDPNETPQPTPQPTGPATVDVDLPQPPASQATVDNIDHVDRLQPTTTPGAAPATAPVTVPAGASFAAVTGTNQAPNGVVTAVAHRGPSFSEVADHLQALYNETPSTATFALADITHSAFSPTVTQPGWLGELWGGLEYTREITPLFTQRALTNYEMVGWKWEQKPTVDKYEGDKKEIPTSTAKTVAAKIIAQRWAGGWDFDRKFLDFNDSAFIASFLRAAREDYAFKTDTDSATWLKDNATQLAGTAPDMLRAASRGAQAVRRGKAGSASFVLVNDADLESLLDFTGLDVPAFLKTLGIAPESWTPSELVAPGSVIVGAKRAIEYYELPGSPIRVRALDLVRGGFDEALYGYDAKHLVNPKGLVKLNWAKPVADAPAGE